MQQAPAIGALAAAGLVPSTVLEETQTSEELLSLSRGKIRLLPGDDVRPFSFDFADEVPSIGSTLGVKGP